MTWRAREWLPAIRRLPGYRVTAVATLALAPESARPSLLQTLAKDDDFTARRLEAELRVRWGDPLGGLAALESALPDSRVVAVDALRGLLDQLRGSRTQEALLARAARSRRSRSALPSRRRPGFGWRRRRRTRRRENGTRRAGCWPAWRSNRATRTPCPPEQPRRWSRS